MSYRHVAIQGTLALAALIAAYFTWQRGAELAPGEVVVVDSNKGDIGSLRFDDLEKSSWVELTQANDEAGPFVSVHLGPQEKPAKPADPKHPAEAQSKTPERWVRGNDSADKLFAGFAPLRANRILGILDPAKLKDLGLEPAQKRITLNLRHGKRTFVVAPPPPGGSEPYLRDDSDGRVYVVARSLLSDFQSAATLLVDRRPHAFRLEEADRLLVSMGTVRREFILAKGENGVHLAPAATPDKPDPTVKTWHDRLFALWPVEVLGKGEVPAEGSPQPTLHVDYKAHGRKLGFIELAKAAAIASSGEAGKDTIYARSERTLGWFKLGADAPSLLTDAANLLH